MCDDDLEDEPVFSKHDRFETICERQSELLKDMEVYDRKPKETLGMRQYEDAFIGYYRVPASTDEDSGGFRAVYSWQGIIKILCEDMTLEDAIEYFIFNIEGSIPNDLGENNADAPIYPLIIQTWTEES